MRIETKILSTLIFFVLLSANFGIQTSATDADQLTYWYEGDIFDVNQDDEWVPFFSGTDVPYSLPLRGFISDSRNYFFDFGALNWLSDWIEYRYAWPVPEQEKHLDHENLTGQLKFLFEMMTARLQKPPSSVDEARNYTALDYVKDFDAPYQAFIPLIVMYGLNETYDDSMMNEWVIHPDIVENSLNEAFPLVTWETELYWFDYGSAPDFADLMEEKHQDVRIMIDEDYLERTDIILHDIISDDPRYGTYDLVLPTLIMLQDYTLWATFYNMAVGGLGRLNSSFPEIDSWCLNGRNVYSYFYGGNPETPRASITSTVIHELGHCIGQTDIHSLFGWLAASTTMSVMAAYQQPTGFDRFDMDLVNNAQALQLWGRYLDEIDYFREFALTMDQQTILQDLEDSLSDVSEFLISTEFTELRLLLSEADAILEVLASELGESRKTDEWSEFAPTLDVHIDWIVGPGFPNADVLVESIESDLDRFRSVLPFMWTTLPTAKYNVTIDIHSTSDSFNNAVFRYWGQNMVESNTSYFSAEDVPENAWDTYPFNKVFQNQSGYSIDGYLVEDWLSQNPSTPDIPDKIQYRFYMMNLENITLVDTESPPIGAIILVAGAAVIVIGALVALRRRGS